MIAIFCLVAGARAFYSAAFDKGRSGALWATLCVLTFYLSQFVFGAFMALAGISDDLGEMGLNLTGILVGAGCTLVLYMILKNLNDLYEDDGTIDGTLD